MKTKNIRVLIGAQAWAYGPAGKASAIGHELRKKKVLLDFIGSDTSYDFCKNTKHFNKFIRLRFIKDYLKLNISKYDAVISVMDPFLSVIAKKNAVPIYYVDSMSRFWVWKNTKRMLAERRILDKLNLKCSLEKMSKFGPDDRQLIGHLFSDFIFTQGTTQLLYETKNKIKNVGSIIDQSFIHQQKRDTVLVSLSGGISPATNLNSAVRYAEMVIDMISGDIKKINSSKRFILTGNPKVIKKISKKRNVFKYLAMNHEQFLKELNRAIVVLVPCGFTTIFESLASNTPVIFLPDNHNGHVYEYLLISETIKKKREVIFPNLLFTLEKSDLSNIRNIEASMQIIQHFTINYFKDFGLRNKYKQKFKTVINNFNKNNNITNMQIKAIKNSVPRFNGAEYIANKVLLNIIK